MAFPPSSKELEYIDRQKAQQEKLAGEKLKFKLDSDKALSKSAVRSTQPGTKVERSPFVERSPISQSRASDKALQMQELKQW